MKNLFTNKPPFFTIPEVLAILNEKYNLEGDVKELYSDRDQNFLLYSNQDKFVLKIFNSEETFQTIDLQISTMRYIINSDFNYFVPKPFGSPLSIEKKGAKFFVCLFEYIKGRFMYESTLHNNEYLMMGQFMGHLSTVLDKFDHPGAHRQFEWDLQNIEPIYRRLNQIESKKNRDTITYFLLLYEKNVFPLRKYLRKSLIHNDGNDHNILTDQKGKVKGIIDFGDMIYSYTVLEPAVCMSYIGQNKKKPITAMLHFLDGYRSIYHLKAQEILSIFHMMSIRLCISVSMAAWRKKIFPENQYLTISEHSSWTLLEYLKKKDISNLTESYIANGK